MDFVVGTVFDVIDMVLDAVFNPIFDKLAAGIKKKALTRTDTPNGFSLCSSIKYTGGICIKLPVCERKLGV